MLQSTITKPNGHTARMNKAKISARQDERSNNRVAFSIPIKLRSKITLHKVRFRARSMLNLESNDYVSLIKPRSPESFYDITDFSQSRLM